jgi:hypothetical protein
MNLFFIEQIIHTHSIFLHDSSLKISNYSPIQSIYYKACYFIPSQINYQKPLVRTYLDLLIFDYYLYFLIIKNYGYHSSLFINYGFHSSLIFLHYSKNQNSTHVLELLNFVLIPMDPIFLMEIYY